jgi:phosphoglycolate phosphatase-like HAD superfamily hydrolase
MLGLAPVVDFDGTLARLDIAWQALRDRSGVVRIDELWQRDTADVWHDITEAETRAAAIAPPLEAVVVHLERVEAIAVLTSNSEASVSTFLRRFPDLERRVIRIVGRETLAGPKTEFTVFERGYQECVAATADARGSQPVIYVGDMDYELEFARRLGATAVAVADLEVEP